MRMGMEGLNNSRLFNPPWSEEQEDGIVDDACPGLDADAAAALQTHPSRRKEYARSSMKWSAYPPTATRKKARS